MSNGFLLDTHIISSMMRQPDRPAARKLLEKRGAYGCTSVIVACELRFGSEKADSDTLRHRVDQVLSRLDVLPLDVAADTHYGRIRASLEARGTPIGQNDLLIAAHTIAHGLTLVTGNASEFNRVDGLHAENWLEP